MAKNTSNGYRRGSVDNRSQVYNPVTEQWVKRNAETDSLWTLSKTVNHSKVFARKTKF